MTSKSERVKCGPLLLMDSSNYPCHLFKEDDTIAPSATCKMALVDPPQRNQMVISCFPKQRGELSPQHWLSWKQLVR